MINNTKLRLEEFLKSRGRSLAARGSAEYALTKSDALQFLKMLTDANSQPLGIESWKCRDGELAIDALDGWYCEGNDAKENFEGAKGYLLNTTSSDEDAFTIQYE
jgi:hypothetical protein